MALEETHHWKWQLWCHQHGHHGLEDAASVPLRSRAAEETSSSKMGMCLENSLIREWHRQTQPVPLGSSGCASPAQEPQHRFDVPLPSAPPSAPVSHCSLSGGLCPCLSHSPVAPPAPWGTSCDGAEQSWPHFNPTSVLLVPAAQLESAHARQELWPAGCTAQSWGSFLGGIAVFLSSGKLLPVPVPGRAGQLSLL